MLGLVAVLALVAGCGAQDADAPPAPTDCAKPPCSGLDLVEPVGEPREEGEYFLLEEFDWGDDAEVVEESLLFDPAFVCRGSVHDRCRLVKVSVDGEDMLASFDLHEGALWQAVFLTPDLEAQQAHEHLERVFGVLVGYVTRWLGEPDDAEPLPELASVAQGPPQPTHRWQRPGLVVEVRVGRRSEDLFYVGAYFFDPSRDAEARPAWEAALAEADMKLGKRRERKAAREAQRAPDEELDGAFEGDDAFGAEAGGEAGEPEQPPARNESGAS